jgi:hypothetical protein
MGNLYEVTPTVMMRSMPAITLSAQTMVSAHGQQGQEDMQGRYSYLIETRNANTPKPLVEVDPTFLGPGK